MDIYRDLPRWVRWVVNVTAFITGMIGVAGLRDDIETWGRWLDWLNEGAPWWVLIVASIVLFALVNVTPIVVAYRRRRAEERAPERATAEEVRGLRDLLEVSSARIDELKAMIRERDEKIRGLERDKGVLARRLVVAPLEVVYRDSAARASYLVVQILEEIRRAIPGVSPIAKSIGIVGIRPLQGAREELEAAMRDDDSPAEMAERAMVVFQARYMESVRTMHDIASGAEELGVYGEWRENHDRFRKDLNKAAGSSALRDLGAHLEMPGAWVERSN